MAGVQAVFAELERDLIAQRTTETLRELRDQGRAWNHAPFGWSVLEGRLVRDDIEQATLARAQELRDQKVSYARIAEMLTREGRRTKRGGRWQAMSVRSVLRTAGSMAAGE